MSATARILDANANRAREAARVMEDAARFALDDPELSKAFKALRHDLREALSRLPAGWCVANRDTPRDVGTTARTRGEMTRTGLHDVVAAAGARLGEALRVIEEVGKTVDRGLSESIESIRYRGYDLHARLLAAMATGRPCQWRCCVLLTEGICRRPWREVVDAVLEGGADCIQLREKGLGGRELVERARWIIERARPRGAAVVINDRVDVALVAGADGVHVGQGDLAVAEVRAIAGQTLLVGVSTHDPKEAAAAVRAGADYCGVGAMFPSSLKPDRAPSGPAYLRHFVETYPHAPHLAIGGITPGNIDQLAVAGAAGVAVSSVACAAEDPAAVVAALRSGLESAETVETP